MSTKPTELASTLATDLRSTVGKIKRRLREQTASGDFTPSQTAVLLRLDKDGPAAVSTLARAEGMRPQSMSAIIAPLEQSGHVIGSPDPNDKRQTLFSLTKSCKKWLQDGRAARQDWLAQTIQRKLSPQEQKQVATAVQLLTRLLED